MPAYIGVNGKAKQIYKVYQGDENGIAHLIWAPPGVYKADVEGLGLSNYRTKRQMEKSASTKTHAFIFSGAYDGSHADTDCSVDYFDTDLVRGGLYPSDFTVSDRISSYQDNRGGAASISDNDGNTFAIFKWPNARVYDGLAIDDDCVHYVISNCFGSSKDGTSDCCSGQTKNYAFFAGGNTDAVVNKYSNNVFVIGSDLTASQLTMESAHDYAGCISLCDKVIIVGGWMTSNIKSQVVECFDNNLTRTKLSNLDYGCSDFTVDINFKNEYGFVACGVDNMTGTQNLRSTVAFGYDSSFTKITLPNTTNLGYIAYPSGFYLDGYAVIAGGLGVDNGGLYKDDLLSTADIYDSNRTKTVVNLLPDVKFCQISATVGKWALLCGGYGFDDSNARVRLDTADAYYAFE